MYDRMRRALHSFKCSFDNMFSRLSKNLDRNVIRNHILLDQCSDKLIFCLRRRRKTNFDHLKTNVNEKLKKLQFLIKTHRFDQRLISVSKIYAAPDRRLINTIFFYPVVTRCRRHKISFFIFFPIFSRCHQYSSPYIISMILLFFIIHILSHYIYSF